MSHNIIQKMAPSFLEVIERHNFKMTEENVDSVSFGNAFVLLDSDDFKIRISRDRGQVFVDVAAPKSEEWHQLEHALEFIGQTQTDQYFERLPDVEKLARELETNYDKIGLLLGSDLKRSGFLEFEKKKTTALISRIFPAKNNSGNQ